MRKKIKNRGRNGDELEGSKLETFGELSYIYPDKIPAILYENIKRMRYKENNVMTASKQQAM